MTPRRPTRSPFRLGRSRVALGLLALALACGGDSAGPTPPAGNPPALRLEPVASGLGFPVGLVSPPGDPRLFVLEKTGRIRIVRDGVVLPAPFLDLSGRVSGGDEQGLLGLAFDPAYASTGRLVVNYTDTNGDTRISLFRVSADPDRADPASEMVLLAVDQPFANHNGGQLAFGPDGYLYIGLGDGGSGGDPFGNGQSLATPLGKILRVGLGGAAFIVPADNPFTGRPGARPEIWSYGLRNPWRFSFDRATGDLYVGDVGQNEFEEIDVAPAAEGRGRGLNFGWNIMEGTHCFGASSCDRTGLTLPLLDYSHADGCSVTGGYVYRGDAIPSLRGTYFYGDYCGGWVRSFRFTGGRVTEPTEWPDLAVGFGLTSFGEDAGGELYVLSQGGTVSRIVPR